MVAGLEGGLLAAFAIAAHGDAIANLSGQGRQPGLHSGAEQGYGYSF